MCTIIQMEKTCNDKTETNSLSSVRDRAKTIEEGRFCGWNIYHRFRCTNGLGMQRVCDVLIIVDERMEYVRGFFMLDDDCEYNFDRVRKVIERVFTEVGNS